MKIQEMREKTIDELSTFITDTKKELFDTKFQKSVGKLEDSSKIGKLRKLIAQAKTIMSEKIKNENKEVVENA